MSKKLLSVLLAILMVVSSVSCLFTATTLTASAAGTNLLDATKGADWTSGWNGEAGKDLDGEIMVKAAYRSVYTKVSLAPNAKHTLTFSFGQTRVYDVRVIPASEISDPTTELKVQGSEGGIAAPDAINLATGTFTAELTSGAPVDGIFYSASETFTTNSEKEYYIILDCKEPSPNSKNNVVLKDLKIEELPADPNVLNDDAMAGLTWNSIWSTGLRNPVASVLDKSQSYSGNAYAMTWGGNSRWRDNYTTVTLEPNTTYDFSFYYKSSSDAGQEYVAGLGFVDASKVDFSTYKGDYVNSHLTDSSTTILGKDNATIGSDKTGNWNLAKTSFTTTDATEYVMYLWVTFTSGCTFSALTLSDFSLQVQTNVLGGTKASDWLRGDTGAAFTNNGSDIFGMAAYRSFYTKVTLKPDTTYKFSFSAKYVKTQDVHLYPTTLIEDISTMYSGTYWTNLAGDLATGTFNTTAASGVYTTDEEAQTYYDVSEIFTTGTATEYYLVIDGGNSSGAEQTVTTGSNSISMKNIVLAIPEKSSNVLNDDAMAGLTWNSIWNTGLRNPVSSVLDNSASYSGEAYAMTWGGNSRYRDNYTTVTLEPNTTYDFSFYYKSSESGQEYVVGLGFVDASKVDFSTYKGDYVNKHLTDSSTPILGKDNATIGLDKTGNWNLVKTSFTTTDATEYVMYLYVTFDGTAFSALTLSDFSLEPAKTTDDLTNTVATDWTSAWTGDAGTYEKVIAVKNAHHSAYTKVTLDAYNDYEFTFNAAWTKTHNVRVYAAEEITDVDTQLRKDSYVDGGTNNLVTSFTTTQPDTDYTTADIDVLSTYYTVTAKFRTLKSGDYYIIIDGNQFNSQNLHPLALNTYTQIKNISLVGTPFEVDADNVLNDIIMPTLSWTALWKNAEGNNADQTITSTVLDKAESYSGNSYVMQWARQVRFRDNYTIVNLEPNTKYELSFRYKAAGVEEFIQYVGFVATNKVDLTLSAENIEGRLLDSNTEILGKNTATIEKELNGTWNLVSTTFTTGEETEYVFFMGIGGYVDNSFSTITLSDFDLREFVDPNKLSDATVANGDVRWSVGDDAEEDYITGAEGKEDELVTYTNGAGEVVTRSRVYYYDELNPAYNYNGGYAWRIIISNEDAMNVYNPAVYGYITAKGLAANTKYTFSYIYTGTYHVKLADIYNVAGSVADIDVTTKMLPTKEGATAHSYMVTATFTTGDEGDYTIKLQTGRSNKYYIYGGDAWAMTVSDLSLTEYEETETVVIPDDANVLETPADLNWGTTWYDVVASEDGYNGTPAISTAGIHYHGIYTMLELEPNTEYSLSFKYKSRGAIDVIGIADAADINLANIGDKFSSAFVSGAGSLTYYQNIEKVIDASTWNTATAKFVTGDNATYYLYLEGNSAANTAASGDTVISDMSLTKNLDTTVGQKVYYDFEDSNIGDISTTSGADKPTVSTEGENNYLTFTKVNDGITVPFYYNGNQKYVVSFDIKVLTNAASGIEMRFATTDGDNNPQYNDGGVFCYRNDAYSLVIKDMNGKLLSGPAGLNNSNNYQFNGFRQNIENHTDWVHYEITIDPDYTYYTGLANFGFSSSDANWSIALDNIKVAALNDEFEADAEARFEPTKYAAIRAKSAEAYQGIRVKSSIDTSLLTGDIKVVEYGTLAINNSKLNGAELVYDMVNSTDYGAKLGVAYSADNGTNVIFEQEGNVVTFTGTLIGLKDYTTDYAVRGYMIAETADGERFVIYEEDTKTVSVYDVVYAILNDGVTNDDDTVAQAIVSKNQAEYDNFVEENYAEEVLTVGKNVNLSVQNDVAPVINNYRGFSGTVYHAFGFMEDDVTGRVYDADMINTELDRLEDAGVHYVRTRYQSQWIFDDATGYDWNSDRFNYFLNYARALQERDMEVILQVGWHFDFISREENATYSIHENDYFNGEGADRYGESAGVAAAAGDTDNARIIRAAYRYAYLMANTVKYAKAQGINNIKYFSYFVEPSNSYSVSEDGSILDKINLTSGHDKEQYVLFCRTMRDAVEDIYNVTDIKHMGPNEAGYSKLTEYVVNNYPDLFDIITAHNYPAEGDVATNYDEYYETMTDNQNYSALNGYMTDFNDYAGFLATAKQSNANAEFWSDEFNIKDFGTDEDARGSSSFYRGLATAMGGIIAQQSGIQNTVLWMSFDQLWTDRSHGVSGTVSEFMNGIHQCGNAPSLFLSDQPYAQYYPTTLFSKYNGYKNGTVYATNLSSTATQGVYVGAVQLEDGSWTVSVLNMNSTAVEITVDFATAINQTLYRHVVSADKADTYADAKIPDADKTFTNVAASFNDVLPAGSFAVYTGVK